jgi:hypothetical protein
VQLGGETSARIGAPLGGATGYRLDLGSAHGPWLGPVGLRVGPALRVDREQWGEAELAAAALVGGSVDLAVDAGPLSLWTGVLPLWALGDARPEAQDPLLPVLGTETTWRLGASGTVGRIDLGLELATRGTAIGALTEATVNLGVKLP